MHRLVFAAGLTLFFSSGCGTVLDFLGLGRGGRETGAAKLIRFASEQEFTDYFSRQVSARNSGLHTFDAALVAQEFDDPAAGAPLRGDEAPLTADGEAAGGFSQTTIQELGVDEADVVKTDGTYLYTIRQRELVIARVSPPDALTLAGRVALEGFGSEIYLYDDNVVALTQSGGGFVFVGGPVTVDPTFSDAAGGSVGPADGDEPFADGSDRAAESAFAPDSTAGDYVYERPRTTVTVVDVSTPEAPQVRSQTRFDGSPVSSRMIGGVLHLVLANYQDYYYDVLPLLGRPELDAESLDPASILPGYVRESSEGASQAGQVVTWRDLYRPVDPDGFGVVTVVSLDVDRDGAFSGVGVVAQPGLVYSSLEALYLTDTVFDLRGATRETTDIFKLAYRSGGAEPVAAGTVPGRVLNQYSMGEYQGGLRVATTVGPTFTFPGPREGPFNNVYVLEETDGELRTVGRIENIAPGETIQSARFVGSRGFLVTFEQIDPLFTLDLSDPRNPRVAGELKVPGFSTFIVEMDSDHLLAVGQYVPETFPFFVRGVQVSIFDVSDFSGPQLRSQVVLGEQNGAWSEALFNPKAFTYFPERGLAALPVSTFEGPILTGFSEPVESSPLPADDETIVEDAASGDTAPDGGEEEPPPPSSEEPTVPDDPFIPQGFDGVIVFRVTPQDGVTEIGRISTRFEDAGFYWSSFSRGVFVGDSVFAVTDRGVRGSRVGDMSSARYELLFPDPTRPAGE